MTYGPYLCIGVVVLLLFILWAFWGGNSYEFVGLSPLDPNKIGSYSGPLYEWENNVCPVEKKEENITISANNNNIEEICYNQNNVDIKNSNNIPKKIKMEKPKGRFMSRGERICCETLEKIYGAPFTSTRPKWLKNPETGHNVEIDCFNEDLRIGVEYNGEQHYKWPNWTNQTYDEFINQVRRDKMKVELCDRNGVYLITVPYNIPYNEIPNFIISHLPETIQKRIEEDGSILS